MSTLATTNIKNPDAANNNIVLGTDASVTTRAPDSTYPDIRKAYTTTVTTTPYTLLGRGQLIKANSGASVFTLDTNNLSPGDTVTIYNNTSGSLTINRNNFTTLRIDGANTNVASITLAAYSTASIICVDGSFCLATGSGVS